MNLREKAHYLKDYLCFMDEDVYSHSGVSVLFALVGVEIVEAIGVAFLIGRS